MDVKDRFWREIRFSIFETASAFYDSCAYGLNNTAAPPLDTITGAIFHVVQRGQYPINPMLLLLFCAIVAVVEVEVGGDKCRKSNFASFRNENLRMTTHSPRYIYREETPRRTWWLHTILVVVWGLGLG